MEITCSVQSSTVVDVYIYTSQQIAKYSSYSRGHPTCCNQGLAYNIGACNCNPWGNDLAHVLSFAL